MNNRSSLLQVIGLIAMTVDHIGHIFFPEVLGLRVIGRFAMPVFAYGVAEGYLSTRSIAHYMKRLLIVACLAQAPFMWAFGTMRLNICFGLLLGLISLFFFDKGKWYISVLIMILAQVSNIEYGLYSLALINIFRYAREEKLVALVTSVGATLIFSYYEHLILQIFAILPIAAVLYLPELKERVRFPRQAFYVYYPVHLLILALVQLGLASPSVVRLIHQL